MSTSNKNCQNFLAFFHRFADNSFRTRVKDILQANELIIRSNQRPFITSNYTDCDFSLFRNSTGIVRKAGKMTADFLEESVCSPEKLMVSGTFVSPMIGSEEGVHEPVIGFS